MGMPPPFPYYGGKRRVTDEVWKRLGNVRRYIEPFAGGASMLLGRPSHHTHECEIINDKDGLLVNVWRAIQHEAEGLLELIHRPGAQVDLYAVSKELQERKEPLLQHLQNDIEYYDLELASKWLWGVCYWKGSEWPSDSKKQPHDRPDGILAPSYEGTRLEWLEGLANRLHGVTIYCREWFECVNSKRSREGVGGRRPIGFFFDPPYADTHRTDKLYHEDSKTIVDDVREWCLKYQDHEDYRIVLCTFDSIDMPDSWICEKWSSRGTTTNKNRECLWFSPGCLTEKDRQPTFLQGMGV